VRLAQELPDADAAVGRLLTVVSDVEQRPAREVAEVLGLDQQALADLLTSARRSLTPAHAAWRCRGWGLASRRRTLTPPSRMQPTGTSRSAAGAAPL